MSDFENDSAIKHYNIAAGRMRAKNFAKAISYIYHDVYHPWFFQPIEWVRAAFHISTLTYGKKHAASPSESDKIARYIAVAGLPSGCKSAEDLYYHWLENYPDYKAMESTKTDIRRMATLKKIKKVAADLGYDLAVTDGRFVRAWVREP